MEKKLKKFTVLFIIGFLLLIDYTFSQPLFHPVNLDFEDGAPGYMPMGWSLPSYAEKAGYKSSLTDYLPNGGKYCLDLHSEKPFTEEMYGSVMQSIDASPYRGKRVIFRAAVRAEISSPRGNAQLWIRERLPSGVDGAFVQMEDNPIVSNEWHFYEVKATIDEYADIVNFGLLLFGTGTAWIDDGSFEILVLDSSSIEKPRPLNDISTQYLTAFAKLYGYVCFFHPSDEVKKNDWQKLTLNGIDVIEKVKSKEEAIEKLNEIFKPVAPSMEIFPTPSKPKDFPRMEPPPNSLRNICVSWFQQLAGVANDEIKGQGSRVVNMFLPQRGREAPVIQVVSAGKYQGKHVKFSAAARAKLIGINSQAQLWIRVDGAEHRMLLNKTMEDNPIRKDKWDVYSIEIDVPDSATLIRLGLVMIGEGEAWFDEVNLTETGTKASAKLTELNNFDFENGEPGKIVRGWTFPQSAKDVGYSASISNTKPYKGKQCLHIQSDEETRIKFPEPGEIYSCELVPGISFAMPLTLYVDSLRTLPYPPNDTKPIPQAKPEGFTPTGKDRTSRLAAVITAWNLLKHFSINKIPDDIIENALPEALKKAAVDKNEEEFLNTLQRLTAYSNDGQTRVWLSGSQERYGLPFLWKMNEGKLVITKTASDTIGIKPGDIVTSIDGIDVQKYLEEKGRLVSSSTKQWRNARVLAEIRTGVYNSQIKIGIKNKEEVPQVITFKRNILLTDLTDSKPPKVHEIEKDLFYVDLSRLNNKELYEYLPSMKDAKGIIFDCRGLSGVTENMVGILLDKKIEPVELKIPVYTKPDHKLISYKIYPSVIEPSKIHLQAKALFLADEFSNGLSETILAIVKNQKIGDIIGTETAGAGGEIIPLRLPAEYYFSMTGMHEILSDGEDLIGKEIKPGIKVNFTYKDIIEQKDPQLEKAIKILTKVKK